MFRGKKPTASLFRINLSLTLSEGINYQSFTTGGVAVSLKTRFKTLTKENEALRNPGLLLITNVTTVVLFVLFLAGFIQLDHFVLLC